MLVSTNWSYYSEMEYKENYRRVMTTCVSKVYDNAKKILYTLSRGPLDVEALGFSLPSL